MPDDGQLRDDLPFLYRCWRPQRDGDGTTLVLLHGSGVDETTMAEFGAGISPRATRIAVRGRVPQEEGWRWFERITPVRFDQDAIRRESAALAEFLPKLAERHALDLRRAIFLGYSNGANLISSTMLLHPGMIGSAVLMRAMPVLDEVPATDLSAARILVIAGARDATYGPFAPALVELLRAHGASVADRIVPLGHEFGADDIRLVREWMTDAATPPAT